MEGHTDTVTGLALSPDGSYLLSNGMDNTGMWQLYAGTRWVLHGEDKEALANRYLGLMMAWIDIVLERFAVCMTAN